MEARQPSRRGRGVQNVTLSIVAVVSWAAAAYFRIAPEGAPLIRQGRAPASSAPTVTASTDSSARAAPTAEAAKTTAVATRSSAVTTSATADAGAAPAASAATSAPAATAGDVSACVAALFPEGTFDKGKPDFAFVCENTDPRRGITEVQAEIVSGRRQRTGVTPGMRQWSHLGWYQVAAYALMRGHCCDSAPELVWSVELPCPFDEAVAKLESAVRAGDATALEGALGYFSTTARCLAKTGLGPAFNQRTIPGPGLAAFRKMLTRMRQADKR